MRESAYVLIKVALALCSSDRRAGTIVVVETLDGVSLSVGNRESATYQIVVIFVILEVLLGEETAELGEAESVCLVGAQLQHSNGIGRGEGQVTLDL